MSDGARTGPLIGIQYLRGIAAAMVAIYHIEAQLELWGYAGRWPYGMAGGVDIFFVISGFIMWVTTSRAKPGARAIGPIGFMRKRLARIAPLYWLVTAATVAVALAAPHLTQHQKIGWWHIAASFLFVAAEHPLKHSIRPVIGQGWTLNYEMIFYLLFAASLLLPRRWRIGPVIAALIALVAAGRLFAPLGPIAAFYTDNIMLEFGFGLLLGVALTDGTLLRRIPAPIGWAMAAIGLVLLVAAPVIAPGVPRVLAMGVPGAAIVAGTLAIELGGGLPKIAWLGLLGDASYSIYLVHTTTQSAARVAWEKLHLTRLPYGEGLFVVAASIASLIVGIAVYWLVERALVRLFDAGRPSTVRAIENPQPAI